MQAENASTTKSTSLSSTYANSGSWPSEDELLRADEVLVKAIGLRKAACYAGRRQGGRASLDPQAHESVADGKSEDSLVLKLSKPSLG
ncbi:hypothetical protein [Erwinia sp.]|uniref:hypothetical protein n=1 Tax=Erwinia citreus TaxID=558 RepID=UPI003C74834D